LRIIFHNSFEDRKYLKCTGPSFFNTPLFANLW
jgi:hypothetical protein